MFGHIHIWQAEGGRCCKLQGAEVFFESRSLSFQIFSPLFSLRPSHNYLFSLSFHPHSPSLFPTSPLPSIPRASSSQTRLTGFFGTPRTHKHTLGCQRTLRRIPLHFNRGSFTQCLRVKQEKTEAVGENRGRYREGVNWRDEHSFGLPCFGAQETCCRLFGLLSPSHKGWQAFGAWCVRVKSVIILMSFITYSICVCSRPQEPEELHFQTTAFNNTKSFQYLAYIPIHTTLLNECIHRQLYTSR